MSPKKAIKNEIVARLITDAAKEKGVRGLAREIGLSPTVITHYTQGKVGEPTQSTLEKLSAFFKLSIPELRGEKIELSPEIMNEFISETGRFLEIGDDQAGELIVITLKNMADAFSRIQQGDNTISATHDAMKGIFSAVKHLMEYAKETGILEGKHGKDYPF